MVEQADGFRSLDDTEQHVTVARVEFGGTQRDHPPEGEVWGSFLGCRGDTLQGKTVERRPAAESLGFKGPGLYCVRLRVSVWLCFSVSGCSCVCVCVHVFVCASACVNLGIFVVSVLLCISVYLYA